MREKGVINIPRRADMDQHLKGERLQIAQSIREKLAEQNMTFEVTAERAGLYKPQVTRVLNGKGSYLDTLLRILDAADLEIVIQKRKVKRDGDN